MKLLGFGETDSKIFLNIFGETLALVHADPGSSNSRDANEEDQQGVY